MDNLCIPHNISHKLIRTWRRRNKVGRDEPDSRVKEDSDECVASDRVLQLSR